MQFSLLGPMPCTGQTPGRGAVAPALAPAPGGQETVHGLGCRPTTEMTAGVAGKFGNIYQEIDILKRI